MYSYLNDIKLRMLQMMSRSLSEMGWGLILLLNYAPRQIEMDLTGGPRNYIEGAMKIIKNRIVTLLYVGCRRLRNGMSPL